MSLGSELPSDGSDVLGIAAEQRGGERKDRGGRGGERGRCTGFHGVARRRLDAPPWARPRPGRRRPARSTMRTASTSPSSSARGGPTFAAASEARRDRPGVNVRAAAANTASGYTTLSGTSMAAPFAAGSIALALDSVGRIVTDARRGPERGRGTGRGLRAGGQGSRLGCRSDRRPGAHVPGGRGLGSHGLPDPPASVRHGPDHGEWTHEFELGPDDLGVADRVSIVLWTDRVRTSSGSGAF